MGINIAKDFSSKILYFTTVTVHMTIILAFKDSSAMCRRQFVFRNQKKMLAIRLYVRVLKVHPLNPCLTVVKHELVFYSNGKIMTEVARNSFKHKLCFDLVAWLR